MPSLESELLSLELYKKKYSVNPSNALESIIKRQEERVKKAKSESASHSPAKSASPAPAKSASASPAKSASCTKRYVDIKDGCNSIRRVVYRNEQTNKPYVKMNGKDVYLSTIRGKYRYSDI